MCDATAPHLHDDDYDELRSFISWGKVSKRSCRWIASRRTILSSFRVFSFFQKKKLKFLHLVRSSTSRSGSRGGGGWQQGASESSEQCPALLTPLNKEKNSLFLLLEKCFCGNGWVGVKRHSKNYRGKIEIKFTAVFLFVCLFCFLCWKVVFGSCNEALAFLAAGQFSLSRR